MDDRTRALQLFLQFLDYANALDLEYACFIISETNGSSYSRPLLRALYSLYKSPLFIDVIKNKGALVAMALDESLISPSDPTLTDATLKDEDIESYRSLIQNLSKNDMNLSQPAGGINCSKCKSTDIFYEFKQIRSADEGTTVFCVCSGCNKRWKLG